MMFAGVVGRSLISFIPVIGFFIFLIYELRRGDQREFIW